MKRSKYWLWLLLLVPIALGLMRLHFDVEVLDLLPPELKVVQGLKLYQEEFANARELLIAVRGADANQTEETAHAIADKLRGETNLVASVIWEPPWLEHPDQAAELLAFLWLNQPPEEIQALTNRLALTNLAPTLAAAREALSSSMSPGEIGRLIYDPYGFTRLPERTAGAAPAFGQGQEMFSSPEGTFRIMFVQSPHDLTTYKECDRWLKSIRHLVDEAVPPGDRTAKGIKIGYTGRPAFVAEVASGMEHDINSSVGGTALIIAGLFWFAHRRWKPMLWLLTLLALILFATFSIGALIFSHINVISMGFAAILLGLAVDYAVVHYQEALAHPDLTIPEIRRGIAPSIFWAAVTTITAFLVLNFGGLPGLAQLGSLVGLGVAISACVMIFAFLPPLFPGRWIKKPVSATTTTQSTAALGVESPPIQRGPLPFIVTGIMAIVCAGVLIFGLPAIDPTANALRPRNSPAYGVLDDIKNELNQKRDVLWLLVSGATEKEVGQRLDQLEPILANAATNQWVSWYTMPTPLWPRPDNQEKNRSAIQSLIAERPSLHEAIKTNDFTEDALALTDRILDSWSIANAQPGVFWPTNPMSHWIFDKITARTPTNFYILGFLNRSTNSPADSMEKLKLLEAQLPTDHVWLSGWELLGSGIFSSVKKNMWKLVVPMVSLVFLSLLLAFRAWREVVLSVLVLMLSGLCLLTVMRLSGWSWNLLNLMALPLILGTGVDYSIFMQLALRRYHGDLRMAHRAVGRALLLCGATAIAGFGSLAWSSNAGMASLGSVCAVGIAFNVIISVALLPRWWDALRPVKKTV